MLYVGIDPSFTKTGTCYLDTDKKTILFNAISPDGKNEDYIKTIERASYVSLEIIKRLTIRGQVKVILEEPLAMSMKASRLGILSGLLGFSLLLVPSIERIYTISPSYIARLNNPIAKRKGLSKKMASQYVVEKILSYMQESMGYKVIIHNDKLNKDGSQKKRKLSHDEAESFILLLRMLDEENFIDKDFKKELVSINRNFNKEQKLNLLK
jgi:hypothetical protein